MSIKTVYPNYNQETKITSLDSTILKIDKKLGLIYNEKVDKFYKIKASEVTDTGHRVELKGENNDVYAFKDPDIPEEIIPIFSKNLDKNGGVTVFVGKNFVARLKDWTVSKKTLDYSSIFSEVTQENIKNLEEISVF